MGYITIIKVCLFICIVGLTFTLSAQTHEARPYNAEKAFVAKNRLNVSLGARLMFGGYAGTVYWGHYEFEKIGYYNTLSLVYEGLGDKRVGYIIVGGLNLSSNFLSAQDFYFGAGPKFTYYRGGRANLYSSLDAGFGFGLHEVPDYYGYVNLKGLGVDFHSRYSERFIVTLVVLELGFAWPKNYSRAMIYTPLRLGVSVGF